MTAIVDGSNGLTFPDLSIQATSATNATSISSGTLPYARLPAGSILQVVNLIKTDTFTSSTTGSWLDITGMSLSITPKFVTSKIFVSGQAFAASSANSYIRVLRNGTPIFVGDASATRLQVTTGSFFNYGDGNIARSHPINGLDSPANTSAVTYKLQFYINGGSFYFNRSLNDGDTPDQGRGVSTITLMEVAA